MFRVSLILRGCRTTIFNNHNNKSNISTIFRRTLSSLHDDNKAQNQKIIATDRLVKPMERVDGRILSNCRTEYRVRHHYQGKVKGVILDWAGTVLDCGVYSPAIVFMEAFKSEGVPITIEEAREPMGTHKLVHIRRVTQNESVRKRWFEKHGRYPNEDDVTRMYDKFVPMQLEVLENYSQMIEGATETIQYLQNNMGLKVGSCTGFTTPMIDILKRVAADQGYFPDAIVASDEVPQARPYPYMIWMNCIRMDINPIQAVVKVDDTIDGISEGITAGCWTVGLARTGNYVGMNHKEIEESSAEDYERRLQRSYDILGRAGAHYVIDTINDLPTVLDDVNRRLASGEHP